MESKEGDGWTDGNKRKSQQERMRDERKGKVKGVRLIAEELD